MSHRCSRNFWNRREFLFRSGGGISGLALAYLLDRHGLLAADDACAAAAVGVNPYAPKAPHFKPRATAVISLFMGGGWSQVDTFDHPDMNVTAGARHVSTVPTQALTLLNNPFVLSQADFLAARVKQEGSDPESQVKAAYRIALARPATVQEIRIGADLITSQSLTSFTHVVLNLDEFVYMR